MRKNVTIIGAGVAGICAANKLIDAGFTINLVEARNTPGGRINSFTDRLTGDVVDNGQHLLMGAYTNFLDLLKSLNTYKYLKFKEKIDLKMIGIDNEYHLKSGCSGKIGMLSSILNLKHITLNSKIRIVNFFTKLNFNLINGSNLTCYQLLQENDQTDESIKIFWEPLVLATLNSQIEDAPADLLIVVLRRAFFSSAFNSMMVLPTKGLSELIEPIIDKINQSGSDYYPETKLKKIEFEGDRIKCLNLSNDSSLESDYYLVCTQPNELLKFLPENDILSENLKMYVYSPIISVYLWFDKDIFDFDFAGIVNSEIHWVFNRRKIMNSVNNDYPCFITLVISSADKLIEMNNKEILDYCINELEKYFSNFTKIKLLHSRIIKEKFATFRSNTKIEPNRPTNRTRYNNLFIAGDWTNTQLPATIEGAAVSGGSAAEEIIKLLQS